MIFMDIHMPGKDGIATAQEIQSRTPKNAKTPIFLWSADVSLRSRITDTGVDWAGFIAKPTSRDQAVLCLKQVNHAP